MLPLLGCGSVLVVTAYETVPGPVEAVRLDVIKIQPCVVAGVHSQVVATPNEPTPPATGTVACAGVSEYRHVDPNWPMTRLCAPIWIAPFRAVAEEFAAT